MDFADPSARNMGSRLPTKAPTYGKLTEISSSETNARAGNALAAPSYTTGIKHKATNRNEKPPPGETMIKSDSFAVTEPPSKTRKASNEHTGETYAAPSTHMPRPTANGRPTSSGRGAISTAAGIGRPFGLTKGGSSTATMSTGMRAPSHSRTQSAFTQSRGYNAGTRTGTAPPGRTLGTSVQGLARTSNCNDSIPSSQRSQPSLHLPKQRVGSAGSWSSTSTYNSMPVSRSASWASSAAVSARDESSHEPVGRTLSQLHQANSARARIASLNSAFGKLALAESQSDQAHGSLTRMNETTKAQDESSKQMKSSVSRIPTLSPKKSDGDAVQVAKVGDMGPPPLPLSYSEAQSQIPSPTKKASCQSGSPTKKTPKAAARVFLSKSTNETVTASWESGQGVEGRLEAMEGMFSQLKSQMEGSTFEKSATKEMIELMRNEVAELKAQKAQLMHTLDSHRNQIQEYQTSLTEAKLSTEHQKEQYEAKMENIKRNHQHEVRDLLSQHRTEIDRIGKDSGDNESSLRKEHRDELDNLSRAHAREMEDLERKRKLELEAEKDTQRKAYQDLTDRTASQAQTVLADLESRSQESNILRADLDRRTAELDLERNLRTAVEARLTDSSTNIITLDTANKAMKAKIDYLEGDNQAQSQAFADLHKRMQEAIASEQITQDKLRAEETLRRKLHNQVQELKGNIRVFCRVRPLLKDPEEDATKMKYPDGEADSKELLISGPETRSAMGTATSAQHNFSFDRVFRPDSQNADVFGEISQLVQSALDGYNVCIFCYGQTGSGKTHTMSSSDGMIPRTARQIYAEAKRLEEKGWSYKMEGSFIEVYNETLNDLLGKAEDLDKKKLEIRHDTTKQKTTVTNITTVPLDSPDAVTGVLARADKNRTVAATMANARSSRSHSVFILSLVGENSVTGERSEGTLNLVDLAGSERLAHSQAEGQRLKETQSINKSLSCLGDVIGALGKGEGGHVPYRNSKLTYLLQYSLGGNSKTLMFVMISPLQAHLSETLTSLKFATKVHNTHIGTAKRQSKVKD